MAGTRPDQVSARGHGCHLHHELAYRQDQVQGGADQSWELNAVVARLWDKIFREEHNGHTQHQRALPGID